MDVLSVLNEMEDGRREYRDDLLTVSAALLAGSEHVTNVTDKDIDTAVCIADRLIRKVDKFVSGPTTLPVPPVVLGDQDDAA